MPMQRIIRLVVFAGCFVVASLLLGGSITQAQAAVYYVSETGSDLNPGTESQPFRTLAYAAGQVAPGDVVYVMNGTYANEPPLYDDVMEVSISGTSNAYITFAAYLGHTPKIISTAWVGIRISAAAYIEINGFEIECIPHINSSYSGNGIGMVNGAHHIRIINNHIYGCGGGGIYATDSDYIHIENNRVHNTSHSSSYANSGISIYHSLNFDDQTGIYKNIIRGNIVYQNENRLPFFRENTITDGNCIILDDLRNRLYGATNPPYLGSSLVENNVCFNNGGRGIHVHFTDNVTVRSNTLYLNNYTPDIQRKSDHGELTAVYSSNVDFYDNVVWARPGLRALRLIEAQNIRSWNNVFYGTTDLTDLSSSDIVADPQFVNPSLDPAVADFNPQPGSPLIDQGWAQSDLLFDIEGRLRPQGSGRDIGAYEYCGDQSEAALPEQGTRLQVSSSGMADTAPGC